MREVLRTNGLVIGYEGKPLFPAVDVVLHEGEHVALVGANGSGKTTLFKTLTGHLKPLQGNVNLCEKPLESYSANERAKLFSLVLTEKPDDLFSTVRRMAPRHTSAHGGDWCCSDSDSGSGCDSSIIVSTRQPATSVTLKEYVPVARSVTGKSISSPLTIAV